MRTETRKDVKKFFYLEDRISDLKLSVLLAVMLTVVCLVSPARLRLRVAIDFRRRMSICGFQRSASCTTAAGDM